MKKKFTMLFAALLAFVGVAKAQLVETSTAEAPKYYVIASYNRGGVITFDEVGGAIQHKALTNDGKGVWYFEAAPDNADGGVYIVSKYKEGENKLYIGSDKNVSTTPAVWYVLANGVNEEGVSISSTATISGSNCLDASNNNANIGGWAPNAGDWQGTTWVLFADVENAKYNPNKYINQQGQGGRSINSITINGVTKTTSTYGLAYADHTSRVEFKVVAGSDIAISIARSGGWMHAFAYVDFDRNGFATEGVKEDGFTPTGDLVTYSCYDADNNEVGINSVGNELSGGARNTVDMPNFKAPEAVGTYRLRVKYDWNDLNPNGGEQFTTAGSQFVDVILNVVDNPLAPVIPLAEALYATAKDNAGSAIGEYPTDKVNALAAAIEVAKAIADDAATAEDVATLQAAMDAVKVNLPEVGKYYQIHSALSKYAENQDGAVKAVFSNGTNLRWKTLNEDDQTFYWKAVASDGNVVFQNAADGKYIAGNAAESGDWTMADAPSAASSISVKIFTKEENAKGYEYGVIMNNWQMHTASHGEGKGNEGNIVSWNTNQSNSASSWYIVEVELKEFCDITYNFVYNEAVKYTSTTSVAKNAAYPAVVVPTLPYGVTANAATPEGTVTETATFNFELTVEHELPFVAAADVNSINTWYYAQMHRNANVTAYVEDNENEHNNVEWADKTVAANEIDSHLWGFAGDIWNGIKMVNKGTGRAIVSTSGAAVMGDAANATAFIPTYSNGAYSEWFCLKYPESNYLNAQGDIIASWGDADNGSSFKLTSYQEKTVTISEVDYSTLYLDYATYIPEGVEVYAVSSIENGYVALEAVEGVLPANTGVILKNAGDYTFVAAGATGNATSLLQGSTTDTYVAGNAYVLAAKKGVVGLYKAILNKDENGAEGTTHFKNNAFKAYLPVAEGEEAPAMFTLGRGGEDEDTTGIDQLISNGEVVIYDLAGRRVEKMEKGIYIVNGKKVIR